MASSLLTDLAVDDPVELDAGWQPDIGDRRTIDNQIQAAQQHLVDSLLSGVTDSWFYLSGSSAALAQGDCFCASSEPPVNGIPVVTLAIGAALTNAGRVSGIARLATAPGGRVRGAIAGVISNAETGLTLGAGGNFVRCDIYTGRCVSVGVPVEDDFLVGSLDDGGNLSLGFERPVPAAAGGSSGVDPQEPRGRLTLTTGVAVTTADVTAATNVFYTIGERGGSVWVNISGTWTRKVVTTDITYALGTKTAGRPYDLFLYWTGSALDIEALSWTNDTTRVARDVDADTGFLVKGGDSTRLFIGTVLMKTTTQTEDSFACRYLINAYNQEPRELAYTSASASWDLGPVAWERAEASASSNFNYLCAEAGATILINACIIGAGLGGAVHAEVGIGHDQYAVDDSTIELGANLSNTWGTLPIQASYRGRPGIGPHTTWWLQKAGGSVRYYCDGVRGMFGTVLG